MYSAISVVLVIFMLDKCECSNFVTCYYYKCSTEIQVSKIACNASGTSIIKSLDIMKITEAVCAVEYNTQRGCCGDGNTYETLDERDIRILTEYTYVSCSWVSRCSFLPIVNEFTTEPKISLFVTMNYSCLYFGNIYMCEDNRTKLEMNTHYHLMASSNTQSDAFSQHCQCTAESNKPQTITIVQLETDIRAIPQCAILTVNGQTYGCSNKTIEDQIELWAVNTHTIELRNIQRNQDTPWIIIHPITNDGEVHDLMCVHVIAKSSSAAKRGTDRGLVFSLNKVACGPVVTTVTTTADASTTEATVTSSVDHSDSTTTTTPHSPSTYTPTVTNLESPTPISTSPTQAQTGSGSSTQKMSSKDTDDDAGFPVAAAVSVPLALVAVAVVIVAIIICRRFKQKSKGDPDIYEGSDNKDSTVNHLHNPMFNIHDIDANQASIDVYNTIDNVGTEYVEFGDIDDINEYLTPLDHPHNLGIGAELRQQNGDPYENVQVADLEAATADRMPPHYELLETAGDFASAAAYTDLRGVDMNTPSLYQTLTSQLGQMDDKPNRSESPVMVDSQDGTVTSDE